MSQVDIRNLPPVLTAQEVCKVLRLKKSTFYDLCKNGHIPCIRLGRQLRVTRKTILNMLGEVAPQPDVIPLSRQQTETDRTA